MEQSLGKNSPIKSVHYIVFSLILFIDMKFIVGWQATKEVELIDQRLLFHPAYEAIAYIPAPFLGKDLIFTDNAEPWIYILYYSPGSGDSLFLVRPKLTIMKS